MRAAPEIRTNGDRAADAQVIDAVVETEQRPDWTMLRLFGVGRHDGQFRAGSESQIRY